MVYCNNDMIVAEIEIRGDARIMEVLAYAFAWYFFLYWEKPITKFTSPSIYWQLINPSHKTIDSTNTEFKVWMNE